MNISMSEFKECIFLAFDEGDAWGVTYSTWFEPSEEDVQERKQDAFNKVLHFLSNKANTPDPCGTGDSWNLQPPPGR